MLRPIIINAIIHSVIKSDIHPYLAFMIIARNKSISVSNS